ncbi:MAG: primase C-terminal domain-containing protein, partial [Chloroflexota bacterium]
MNTSTISQNGTHIASCETFLTALYRDVPDNLWLEIRCIHPVTTKVRSLWIDPNNVGQHNGVLKQANQLNREGYGIYFAPCLRQEQKGSTEHAAVATALWIDIDCDDDTHQRDKALKKLEAFDPVPSIIVDSGGGWHAYWLLDEPYLLENDEHKKHISLLLQGLFSALDGDEGYVKSVASVMRLPDSTNTKPTRGGVICAVKQFVPERRYAISEFEWLKSTSKTHVTVQIGGKRPLPPRTQDYLASGSSDGSRNNDLFAAACQLRDAGYSQSDAENQLVSRYVADASAGENASTREKEARKTIASAYSQSARDPIA